MRLPDDLFSSRFAGERTPEEVLDEVVSSVERSIRALKPGESIMVSRRGDDDRTPWMLTWKSEPNPDE